jgi:hypothetical protein
MEREKRGFQRKVMTDWTQEQASRQVSGAAEENEDEEDLNRCNRNGTVNMLLSVRTIRYPDSQFPNRDHLFQTVCNCEHSQNMPRF